MKKPELSNPLSIHATWLLLFGSLTLASCNQAPDDSSAESVAQPQAQLSPVAADDAGSSVDPAALQMTVYKSPTCGCCSSWISYLEEEGFTVEAIDHDNLESMKPGFGLPDMALASCHTGIIDGYLIEGHVPASDILRLLRERPANVKGLTAPGMPMMSPGMASRTPKDYDVLSFTETGETAVYSSY